MKTLAFPPAIAAIVLLPVAPAVACVIVIVSFVFVVVDSLTINFESALPALCPAAASIAPFIAVVTSPWLEAEFNLTLTVVPPRLSPFACAELSERA